MADDFENVTVTPEDVLGTAHNDLREAMLFCESAMAHPLQARGYEQNALEWALGAALDLCDLMPGYADLRARIEAVRDELAKGDDMPIPGLSDLLNRRPKSGGRWITFTSVCMDCGAVLGTQTVHRDDPDAPDEVSHGLCAECLAKRMAELDAEEEKR